MDVIAPGFIGPFLKYTIGWKNCNHVLTKTPRYFSLDPLRLFVAVLPLSFKHEFNQSENSDTQGIIQKVKYIKAS